MFIASGVCTPQGV